MDELNAPYPGAACYGPVEGFEHICSDTPMIAAMLLDNAGVWRELAPHMLPRVNLTLDQAASARRPLLLPSKIIDPPTPPWLIMRRRYEAGELHLDRPGPTRPGEHW